MLLDRRNVTDVSRLAVARLAAGTVVGVVRTDSVLRLNYFCLLSRPATLMVRHVGLRWRQHLRCCVLPIGNPVETAPYSEAGL